MSQISNPIPAIDGDTLQAATARMSVIEAALPEIEHRLRELQSGDLGIQTKTNDMDLVTRADLESEALLKAAIQKHFPEDAILAEESGRTAGSGDGDASQSSTGFLWALDPVDGTINYAHGLPLYSVSIGLLLDGEPVAGIVSLPALGNRYRAIAGQGATRDGAQIQVSATEEIGRALLCTGFPYTRHRMMETLLKGFESVLRNVRGVRRTGSAAIDLCWLAEGRFDCYYEFNLNTWDTAAGTVILREAGGRTSDYKGGRHRQGDYQLAATNSRLHPAFLEVLAPVADAERLPEE
ncbi:MAG: inositol monophosphatase [bacterium]|nr:inositol monophosphatase [bacterium]